jgi:hypothetical protein
MNTISSVSRGFSLASLATSGEKKYRETFTPSTMTTTTGSFQ